MAVSKLVEISTDQPYTSCSFHFLKKTPLYDEVKPYYFSGALSNEHEAQRSNLEYEVHEVQGLTDLRGVEKNISLQEHGFQLIKDSATVDLREPSDEDMTRHMEDIANMVKTRMNAEAAIAYNFRFRRDKQESDPSRSDMPMGTFANQDVPVLVPHTDQTREGGMRRVQRHLHADEISKYIGGGYRVRILNCWRPLSFSADERPLAMCDFTTIDESDLRSADRASREYVGEIYYVHHNEKQRWYWISGQTPDEVLLFTNFDSRPGVNDVPFMVHSAFNNRDVSQAAQRRESLEIALIVISKE